MHRIFLLLVVCSLLPLTASAQGEGAFGVAPTDVPFGTAIRGEPLHRLISLQNGKDQPVEIELKPGDETGAWALSTERNLTLPPHSTTDVDLEMRVPQDVPNGQYNGSIYVHFLPEANVTPGTSGAKLAFAVRVNLSVEVGGPQVLRLEAGGLFVPDTEESQRPTVYWTIKNTGNVRSTPSAIVEIRTVNGTFVATENLTGPTLPPGLAENVTFRLDATLPRGQYVLRTTLAPPGADNMMEEAWFEVLETGALRRSGTLGAFALYDVGSSTQTHRIPFGHTVELRAPFTNTGQLPVKATLRGYIVQDGKVLTQFVSLETLVDPGETVELKVLLPDLPKAQQYSLTGEVAYSGKVTPSQEAILILEETAQARDETPSPAWLLLVAGIIAALGSAKATRDRRRRRGRQ